MGQPPKNPADRFRPKIADTAAKLAALMRECVEGPYFWTDDMDLDDRPIRPTLDEPEFVEPLKFLRAALEAGQAEHDRERSEGTAPRFGSDADLIAAALSAELWGPNIHAPLRAMCDAGLLERENDERVWHYRIAELGTRALAIAFESRTIPTIAGLCRRCEPGGRAHASTACPYYREHLRYVAWEDSDLYDADDHLVVAESHVSVYGKRFESRNVVSMDAPLSRIIDRDVGSIDVIYEGKVHQTLKITRHDAPDHRES